MGRSAVDDSTEYQASEIQILVIRGNHFPLYSTGMNEQFSGDVMIELSFGEKTTSTHHVIPTAKGEAIFHQKWSLKLGRRLDLPLVMKVIDRRLGVIASHEFPIESLRYYPDWRLSLPVTRWTFVPMSEVMENLRNNGKAVHIDPKPCEVELIFIVSGRKRIAPKTLHKPWWNCSRASRINAPKSLPHRRTRRWVIRDGLLQELVWDSSDIPHEWTATAIGHKTNSKKDAISVLDRRSPNRQAFLHRQSHGQVFDLLQLSRDPSTGLQTAMQAALHLSSAGDEQVFQSISAPETATTPLIITANLRFVGKERSLTGILDIVKFTEVRPIHHVKNSLWNSLPNLLIEFDHQAFSLNDVLTESSRCPHAGKQPLVLNIRPRRVPVRGGTVVTITGQNLGECRADILLLCVGGLDCLDDLEYLSRNKLRCTTKPFFAGTGTVSILTQSGGRGSCRPTFEYYDAADLSHLRQILAEEDLDMNERVKLHEAGLEQEIHQLVLSVVTLEQYNLELRTYLDNLEALAEKAGPILHSEAEVTERIDIFVEEDNN